MSSEIRQKQLYSLFLQLLRWSWQVTQLFLSCQVETVTHICKIVVRTGYKSCKTLVEYLGHGRYQKMLAVFIMIIFRAKKKKSFTNAWSITEKICPGLLSSFIKCQWRGRVAWLFTRNGVHWLLNQFGNWQSPLLNDKLYCSFCLGHMQTFQPNCQHKCYIFW